MKFFTWKAYVSLSCQIVIPVYQSSSVRRRGNAGPPASEKLSEKTGVIFQRNTLSEEAEIPILLEIIRQILISLNSTNFCPFYSKFSSAF